MVKHFQTIPRLWPTNCLSVFDHFVGLALKGLKSKFRQFGAKLNPHQIYLNMCAVVSLKVLNPRNLTGFSFSQNLLSILDNIGSIN